MSAAVAAAAAAAVAAAAAAAQLDGVDLAKWARGVVSTRRKDGRRVAQRSSAAAVRAAAKGDIGQAAAGRRAADAGSPSWFGYAVAAIVGACGGLLLGGLAAAVMLGAIGAGVWGVREARRRGSRSAACEKATPSLARSLADALRGGASVRSAMASVASDRSVPAALREELTHLARVVRLGAPVESSLATFAHRGGPTLRLLCGTIAMHLEAGGALAAELERLAASGEAALRTDEERIAATAQARATVRVVAALPVLALIGAELASNDFLPNIAAKPAALGLLMVGLVLEVSAIAVARAIVGSGR